MDPRVQAMANILVNYSVGLKKGDWAVIQSPVAGESLANACSRSVIEAGGNPTVLLQSDETQEILLRNGNDQQVSFTPPVARTVIEQADVLIGLLAPINTRSLAGIDPGRAAMQQKAQEPVFATYMQRAASGELRWTVAQYPTAAAAQDAGMSLHDYEEFVYGAGLLFEPDPVQAWKNLAARQQAIIDWLSDKQTIHITGPGTDLTVSVAARTWINDTGHENFPGGEVFTGPIEDSTQGVIQFTFPAFYQGREVTGVRLAFERGVVVEATATSDEDYLNKMLDMDAGARRLGEFAFGTNPGIQTFTKNTLFDEKIGGTLHMALGRAYPETGGENVSALHWDMVYDLRGGSEVTVDGKAFSRNGEFCI